MSIKQATPSKIVIILFLTSIATFWSSIRFEFVLDDLIHITSNPAIQSVSNSINTFFSPTFPGNLYRPFVTLSYALNYLISGYDPWSYHLVNIILNGGVVVLIFLVLSSVFELQVAAWVSILFAVHPLHVEAVANVHGRTELLAAFFVLLGIYILIKAEAQKSKIDWLFYTAALIVILFGMCSKESALVVLPLYALIQIISGKTINLKSRAILTIIAAYFIYFIFRLSALNSLFGSNYINFVDNELVSYPGALRIVWAITLLGQYIALTLFPFPLSSDYSYAHLESYSEYAQILYFLFAVLFILYGAVSIKSDKERAFGPLWFFVAFLITSNLVFPIGTVFGERLAYLPSLGVIIFFVVETKRSLSLKEAEIFYTITLICLAGYSIVHAQVWRTNDSLYDYQIKASPMSVRTLSNYAVVQRNKGNYNEALTLVCKALTIYPIFEPALFVKATILQKSGDLMGAKDALQELLKVDPEHQEGLYLLGAIYFNQEQNDQAQELFSRLLQIDGSSLAGLRGMLAIAVRKGQQDMVKKISAVLSNIAPDDIEVKRLLNERKN